MNKDIVTNEELRKHFEDDLRFQKETEGVLKSIDFSLKRMQPMLQLFEENKIVKARLSQDAKTIIFYAGGVITLAGAWYIFKTFLLKLFI